MAELQRHPSAGRRPAAPRSAPKQSFGLFRCSGRLHLSAHRISPLDCSGVPHGLFSGNSPQDCSLRNAHASGLRPSVGQSTGLFSPKRSCFRAAPLRLPSRGSPAGEGESRVCARRSRPALLCSPFRLLFFPFFSFPFFWCINPGRKAIPPGGKGDLRGTSRRKGDSSWRKGDSSGRKGDSSRKKEDSSGRKGRFAGNFREESRQLSGSRLDAEK